MEIDFSSPLFSQFKFTEEELLAIKDLIEVKQLKRNDHFIKEGDKCEQLGLLVEGALYAYTLDENADEVVHHFYYPSSTSVYNFISHAQYEISDVSIKCHQDSILYMFNLEKLLAIYEEFPRFYQLELVTLRQHYIQATHRIKVLQLKTSEEKIEAIKAVSPGIFLHFPFSLIASYLGMHRNTFTRALNRS